ncbi:MAG: endonuclease/exonuclease/phosphatase family protein [Thermomicrobiales bacterium]|nr:endonuclease/exonuclease/phosphatase family protein [Thermomicrobiales bacterium]
MPSIFDHPNIRVMTYNLKNGGDLPHWEQRKQALVETIRSQQPTILGTQEGYEYQLAYLRDELEHYDMFGEGRDPAWGGEYAAIFVDRRCCEVAATGTFWLSPTPEVPGSRMPNEDLPRIATWARMTVNGTPLLHINTHLTYVVEGIPAQMAVLVDQITPLIDPAIETIIGGDFNIGRHREAMQKLNTLGFTDVWSFAADIEGPVITTPEWDTWDETVVHPEEYRIDWICVRPADGDALPNVTVETVQTHLHQPVPSDHFPVVVSAHE